MASGQTRRSAGAGTFSTNISILEAFVISTAVPSMIKTSPYAGVSFSKLHLNNELKILVPTYHVKNKISWIRIWFMPGFRYRFNNCSQVYIPILNALLGNSSWGLILKSLKQQ